MARRLVIKWGTSGKVTARFDPGTGKIGAGILLAHGAGAGQDHPFMVALRRSMAGAGLGVMTFNYAYTEEGRKAPDRLPKLLEVHRAAADRMATYFDSVYLGGKSMGGRVGSHLVGDGSWPAAGLVYYGYPLVAMGKTEPRDTSHLSRIDAPQLFLAGSRDRLSPPTLIAPLAKSLPVGQAVIVADGDHSFKVPKRTGRSHEEVIRELATTTVAWIEGQ
ncbi:MAG: dienelactone hydrolase [Acidimicrobiia bacterium]|nr:dienelactone hydrolase [Acidimicrobiia bacterium]